ncbi:MAG: PLD nuclease N-terminal domain-containing protein [Rhodoglobus sp.]
MLNSHLADLPVGALVALGVLAVLEIALDVVALVNLYRRPAHLVTLPSKWIWVAIIVLVNVFGAILYFALGRKPALVDPAVGQSPSTSRSAADIADALYGKNDETPTP